MCSLDKIFYHFNAYGDVVVLTNASGSKTKSYSYNAFGVEYNEATLDDNPFRYCGEYYDKETKTIYLRARYYDSAQGRFTQEDPIRDGYNWYSYCGGNPIMFVDPSGNIGILFWLIAGFSAGVAISCAIAPTSEDIKADAEKHYARNDLNKIDKDIDEIKNTYDKQPETMDDYHENINGKQGDDAVYNDKYLSPDGGHLEVIICSPPDKEPYIVDENVDEMNMGTYNYASNEIPVIYHFNHFFQDMIPYYLYGNTRSDKTGLLKPILNDFK